MAKKPPIKYTNREFETIKEDLVEYAKRYYPNSFKDFNQGSFGALMLDTVAYVGDVLSFYLDYQANEQFLSSAVEYDNVVKLAKQHGYRWSKTPTSTGFCTFFCLIPSATGGGVDERYAPILKKGSEVQARTGATFVLTEDVNFGELGLETVVAKVDDETGLPTHFARKAYGRVISGKVRSKSISVGDFKRFRKVPIGDDNIAEVLSVIDTDGHEYFEVDYLTQNIIYKSITNNNTDKNAAPFILKPFPAPRRFIIETDGGTTFMRFGFGSEDNLATDQVADPAQILLDLYGKDYSADDSFDPYKLLNNDKMGVGPANTTLICRYRQTDPSLTNVAAKSVNSVSRKLVKFNSNEGISSTVAAEVRVSIEVENEEPILGDISEPDSEEVRLRALSMFASQNRAVTREDYIALVYSMEKKLGAIKRCNIYKDRDSFRNNLNLYVVSEDENGFLTSPNATVKQNLKTWLTRYRMISDSIDILDASIVNFGIDFEIVSSLDFNKFDVVENCLSRVKQMFNDVYYDIGESIKINDIYATIINTKGVVDVSNLEVYQKSEAGYEQTNFKFDAFRSPDGRYVIAPEGVIFELRYPSLDIRGATK